MVDDCDVGCWRITIAWNAFGNDVFCWRILAINVVAAFFGMPNRA